MPLQLTDDLFDHLAPPETVEWTLDEVRIPRTNPKPVTLLLKFAGRGSPYLIALAKCKPLDDRAAASERALGLFAKHAVAGWKDVLDNEGKPAAYTTALGADLLLRILRKRGIPGQTEMDAMIGYAASPSAFREQLPEAKDLGEG